MRKTHEIKLKHSFYFHGFLPYMVRCMNMNLIMTEDWCPHWFPNVAAFLAATHLAIISCDHSLFSSAPGLLSVGQDFLPIIYYMF